LSEKILYSISGFLSIGSSGGVLMIDKRALIKRMDASIDLTRWAEISSDFLKASLYPKTSK
jgi:hypothetical protein